MRQLTRRRSHNSGNSRLTVDTAGRIYLPDVGAVLVAGLRASELKDRIAGDVNRYFHHCKLSVSLSDLRSNRIYAVGETQRSDACITNALSTAMNALFAAGDSDFILCADRSVFSHQRAQGVLSDYFDGSRISRAMQS